MFIKNQNVILSSQENNYKVVATQNRSTPGIYLNFNLEKNKKYMIDLIGLIKQNGNQKLICWIGDQNKKMLKKFDINNNFQFIYKTSNINNIKIGVFFSNPNQHGIIDYFYISDIKVIPFNKEIDSKLIKKGISIIIPCLFLHLKFIPSLLLKYNQQTLLPNEIILVIAESNKMDQIIFDKILQMKDKFKFDLIIKLIDKISYSGNSRYEGVKISNYDKIIFQDADDIPYDRRIEIINYFFNKYPYIVHICHQWSKNEEKFMKMDIKDIKQLDYFIPNKNNNIFLTKFRKINHIANGNIAIKRDIYKKIKWYPTRKRQQDIKTNINIFEKYRKTLFIKKRLYLYRCNNSSYHYTKQKN